MIRWYIMKNSDKKPSAVLDPVRAASESIGRNLSAVIDSVTLRRILVCAAYFVLLLIVAGTEIFPGTYPLGIAAFSSVTGFFPAIAAFIGAVIGSLRIDPLRGVYLLSYSALFILRLGTSLWLNGGKGEKGAPLGKLYNKLKETGDIRSFFLELRTFLVEKGGVLLKENIRVRVALSAVSALFAGAWAVVDGGYAYYDLFGAIFSLVTVPFFTYLFYAATSRNMRASRAREIGIFFICAAVALSLHEMSILPIPSDASLAELGIVRHGLTFDFGALAAFAATMLVTLGYGTHRGVLCGLVCGAVLTPIYAPAYAVSAVACGMLSNLSPTFAVLFGGTLASAWGIYVGGFDGMALLFPPVVAGCALLIPTYHFGLVKPPPDLFLPTSAERRRVESSSMAELSYSDIKRRVEDISGGLFSVSAVLEALSKRLSSPERSDMREIVESVFSFHCATCKNRGKCEEAMTAERSSSTPLTRKMADSLVEFGVVSADIVPSSLAAECWNMERILDEINLTAGHKISAQSDGNSLSVTADDYSLVASLIDSASKKGCGIGDIDEVLSAKLRRLTGGADLCAASVTAYGDRRKHIFVDDIDVNSAKMGAEDIRRLFESAAGCRLTTPEFRLDGAVLSLEMRSQTLFNCKTGVFSRPASSLPDENAVRIDITDDPPADICGDVVTSFETDGIYYMILSDGMGTGKEAALTSGIVVSLLERLIKSGADLECALKMLNQIIRSTSRECSATVDIAEIDLMTGEARFIKSGAAPSFVIRDGSIFRLQSKTVPIGIIRALDAEMIRFDIREGDTVVMVSDGAARSYDEVPWLLDMMTHDEDVLSGEENKAAEKIVREARRRGSADDITAGIVRVMSPRGD